ncbi:MAG: XTP/dITP diphosphatase [Deltaproteobacteria bacterium]|nr:XTP/dITP diphosphatase [Deltaproteobacteria bacterium]
MREIVVASANSGKLREIKESFKGMDIQVLSLKDFPTLPPVEEDGRTFRANALKKARAVAQQTGRLTIADDSGLEVDYLQGKPGVHSARFAGEEASDADNNRKLLGLLKGIPPSQRGAAFRCVIAIADPTGKESWVEGECKGVIGEHARGTQGFGYDPLFIIPELGKTLAELPLEEKNRISHRGKALAALKEVLRDLLGLS